MRDHQFKFKPQNTKDKRAIKTETETGENIKKEPRSDDENENHKPDFRNSTGHENGGCGVKSWGKNAKM